ncbi:hypothetical protein cand_002120 [Cryptosporidium andersoni]|uniref:Uncharacterized protein n=1 Tax=Cryptosporidium andersoni TaxID=117008 RepID=A0A1J4MTW5_9CRYT|nr:hypothetical protein cand_002120 [Cryptosporidium andersoni]
MNKLILYIPIYLIYALYFNLLFEVSINTYKSSSNKSTAQIATNIGHYEHGYDTGDKYKLMEAINNSFDELDSISPSNGFSRYSATRKPRRMKNQRRSNIVGHKYNELRRCQLNIISWFQILLEYIHFPFNSPFFPKVFHNVYIDNFMLSLKVLNSNLAFCDYKIRKLKVNKDVISLTPLHLNIEVDSTSISRPFQRREFKHLLKRTKADIKNKVLALKAIRVNISKHLNSSHCSECLYKSSINTLLNIISNLLRIYDIMDSNSKSKLL